MTVLATLALLSACLLVQMFFAASEIAVVSADEAKVRAATERGEKEARVLSELLARRDRLLALILTGVNLATAMTATVLTTFLFEQGHSRQFFAPFILAPINLLIGDTLPKMLALKRPNAIAMVAARPLRFLAWILAPVLSIETMFSRSLRRLAGVSPEEESVFIRRKDLALLIHRSGGDENQLDAILPTERLMISRIFRFTQSEARKAMVPLVRVEAIPRTASMAKVLEVFRHEGYSRLPVFDERIVNIVGVVHVFDLLEAPDLERPVSEITRPVSYFPEATPLDAILVALQRTGESLAVIVDEYGGASGIITVEDVLEEIVGEIEDEYDVREELARVINPHNLAVSGLATLSEINERFGLRLPEGDGYATIGGLVVEHLGHIPKPGEQLTVGGVNITIVRSDARAVRDLMLHVDHALPIESSRRR